MSKTPERKVKDAVQAALQRHNVLPFMKAADITYPIAGVYWMPIQGPYSVQGVHDFAGCWRGIFFSIETKAPDNKVDATEPQRAFQVAVTKGGGIALVGVRDAVAVDHLAELVNKRLADLRK